MTSALPGRSRATRVAQPSRHAVGRWLRRLLASTATPLIVVGCMPAWFVLHDVWGDPLRCSVALQAAIVALLAALERSIPHPKLAPRPPGTLRVALYYNLSAPLVAVALPSLVYVPLAHAAGDALGTTRCWPASWPLWSQVAAVLLVVDFTSYWWHRLGHRPPRGHAWMWRLHAVHHATTHYDVWMGAQVHPLDVAVFGLVGYGLSALLGAPTLAVEAGAFFASIIGAMHHLRAETRCGWLNRIFPFGDHHVVHHSTLPSEDGNYGNVTTLFDQLFGSYVPPRLDPAPVGSWSLPATYPHREVMSQLLSPMARHWRRLGLDGAPAPHTTMTERASPSARDAGET